MCLPLLQFAFYFLTIRASLAPLNEPFLEFYLKIAFMRITVSSISCCSDNNLIKDYLRQFYRNYSMSNYDSSTKSLFLDF